MPSAVTVCPGRLLGYLNGVLLLRITYGLHLSVIYSTQSNDLKYNGRWDNPSGLTQLCDLLPVAPPLTGAHHEGARVCSLTPQITLRRKLA
jgi:hypothetical protein